MRSIFLAALMAILLHAAAGRSLADETEKVRIKKWKADVVELYDKPDGQVVETKPAASLKVEEAERVGQGWLRVTVESKDYYVEASQVRTDLKLNGKPKCDKVTGANGFAASRGYGEGCEP